MTEALARTIYHAAHSGNTDSIMAMLRGGVDIESRDEDGNTALTLSAALGAADAITTLIGLGADIETKNDSGLTPFMAAVQHGMEIEAAVLIGAGADIPETFPDGTTVIEMARERNCDALVRKIEKIRQDAEGEKQAAFAAAAAKAAETATQERELDVLSKLRSKPFRKLGG